MIRGFGATPAANVALNPGNAGAVARFLMGVSALTSKTTFVTDYPDSLGKRPQGDLLEALGRLGAQVSSDGGRLPITISGPVRGGGVEVSAEKSSQYASALLFLAPLLPEGLDLRLTGDIKSHAPLRQTLDTLAAFGIRASSSEDLSRIRVPGGQKYTAERVHGAGRLSRLGGDSGGGGDFAGRGAARQPARERPPGRARGRRGAARDGRGHRAHQATP